MKCFLLHGLGQSPSSWEEVVVDLPSLECEALSVETDREDAHPYLNIRKKLERRLREEKTDFILVGLSLGGMLALDLARENFPQLKGIVLSGTQYNLASSKLFGLQIALMKCLPAKLFEKAAMDKKALLAVQEDIRMFNLSSDLAQLDLPVLVICGRRDRANLRAAKELAEKLPQAEFALVAGGHVLNTETPQTLARLIEKFYTSRF